MMIQSKQGLASVMSLVLVIGVAMPGCDSNLTLDSAFQSLLGDFNLSADSTIGDLLSVLTSGDLAGGFDGFVARANGRFAGGQFPPGLTAEQIAEIEGLQAQLNEGSISREEFAQLARQIVGDRAPNMAFGGFGFGGAPFGFGGSMGRADLLDLSESQQEAARDIFEQLHGEISELRAAAHENIRGVLTDEQLAALEEMRERRTGFAFGGQGRGPRRGFGGDGRAFAEILAEELGLSEDQQATIETVREDLRSSVMDLHSEAREAFIALLTPEQLAMLDEFEANFDLGA